MKGHLAHIEISRLMSVIDDAIDRIHVLSFIPVAKSLPNEVLNEIPIQERKTLNLLSKQEIKLEQLVEKIGAMARTTLKFKDDSSKAKEYARQISRGLLNDNISLDKLSSDCEELRKSTQFVKVLKELKGVILHTLNSSGTKLTQREVLSTLEDKISTAEEKQSSLSSELKIEKIQKEADMLKNNEMINRLREELAHITQQATYSREKMLQEVADETASSLSLHSDHKDDSRKKLTQLSETLAENRGLHKDIEAKLFARKGKIEKDVQKKIDEYDTHMTQLSEEISRISSLHSKELERLTELKAYYRPIDQNLKIIAEEDHRIAIENKKKEEILLHQSFSATQIQRVWKGLMARRMCKKLKKKPSGKKRGKGKSKSK